jgi:hypothetical protein
MTQRDLARLLVKIASIVIVVSAFMSLPDMLARILNGDTHHRGLELLGVTLAPVSLSLLAGLAMFWWAGPLVDRTIVRSASPISSEGLDLRAFEEIALTVLGFYIVTAGVAEAVYYWAKWGFYDDVVSAQGTSPIPIPRVEFAGLLAGLARLLIGILLIAGSRGFTTFKRRVLALRPMKGTL